MLLAFAWLAVPSHAWLPLQHSKFVPPRTGGGVVFRAGGVSDGGPGSLDDEVNAELLAALPTPTEPDASIPPTRLAQLFARGLQSVDSPTANAGLKSAFPFMTFECRKAVTARQGATSVELFVEYGRLSPALAPFMHCAALKFGEPTFTDATATRGALASFPVEILRDKGLRHPSGFQRDDVALGDIPVGEHTSARFVVRMQQQRRPPLQGCWLVSEVMDIRCAFAGKGM